MLDLGKLAMDLASVTQPVERANGLPNALYTSSEALDLERERIFKAGWVCIGFGKDVPEPGDTRPIDLLGMPLLLLRDREGEVRVFENVCRHRGMILVDQPKNFGGVIRCPYHSWCYSLDGKLRATPHVGGPGINAHESIDRDTIGLTVIATGMFMDAVFVNISRDAAPFEDWIAPVRARLADFADRPLFAGGEDSNFKLDVGATGNWRSRTIAKAIMYPGSIRAWRSIRGSRTITTSNSLALFPARAQWFTIPTSNFPGSRTFRQNGTRPRNTWRFIPIS